MVPLRVGNHEKAPTGHGASKLSVAPWVVKTKMAPRGPGKDARGSWSHEALGGSMCRQDQNAPPKPGKDTMEPPRPLWLHGSPGAKWHPKDSEDVNPEQLEQGWMKALRRSISYAKTINIICNYNLWSTQTCRGIDVPFQFHPNRRRRPIWSINI